MKSMLQTQQTQLTHLGTQQKQHGVQLTQHTAQLNQQGTLLTTQQEQIDYLMKSTVKIDVRIMLVLVCLSSLLEKSTAKSHTLALLF